jgi:hypothetical protein
MPDIFVSPEKKKQEITPEAVPVKGGKNLFSAFNLYPENINFETKDKGEKIILMLRQHPALNVKWIFISVVLLLLPVLFHKVELFSMLPFGYYPVIVLTWYLVTVAYAIEGFFGWYFNVFFITTRRVIDVDFYNLIDKRVSDAEIEKIQDVSYFTRGAMGTTLNFGDVLIQTASEVPELNFERVPNPERVAKILDDLRASVH